MLAHLNLLIGKEICAASDPKLAETPDLFKDGKSRCLEVPGAFPRQKEGTLNMRKT